MTLRILAATLLVALTALPTTSAIAAATRGPGPTIERPGPDTGRTAEPGDPFFPSTTNAPTGNPEIATYPKLSCYFEFADGKVVIHWINNGTAAAPVGAMITGTTSGGIGMSIYLTEPIEPGGTFSVAVDMNQAWFNDLCYATVTV